MKTGIEDVSYLQNFLETVSVSDRLWFNPLKSSLNTLIQAAQEIEAIPEALEKSDPENLLDAFKKQVMPLVDRIRALEKGKSVLMPGGWLQQDLIYEFQKDDQNDLILNVYNGGQGLAFHPSSQSADKTRYQTMICFRIPKEILTIPDTPWLSSFILDLVEPNVLPRIHQEHLPYYLANREYNAALLYNGTFRRVYEVGGKKIEPTGALRLHSRPEKSLYEFVKHNVPDQEKAKLILRALKKRNHEPLLVQTHCQDLQTWPSSAELKRAFVHENNIPLGDMQENMTINPSPLLDRLIEKPYFVNCEDYASKAIDSAQCSVTRLKSFQIEMGSLLSKQYYPAVEKQIFSYLTTVPLTETYYHSMTSNEAVDYINTIHTLLEMYYQACEANQNSTLSPQRVVLLLSLLTIIDIIHKNPKLSIYPKGIDGLFEANHFSAFKKQLRYNPYLSTGIPLLESRLNEILSQKEADPLKPFTVDIIQAYLNRNKVLKGYLDKLYQDNQTNKNTAKFSPEQEAAIKHKKLTAVVAYLYYLEGSNQYQSERDKIVLFKKSIILSHCISMAMAQHKLEPLQYKNYLNAWIGISHSKDSKGNLIYHIYEKYLLDNLSLDKNKSIEYFNKIQDPIIAHILDSDFTHFPADKRRHANDIFSLANGQNNDNPHSDLNPLYRELHYLRSVPELQFLLTIEYFCHDNLELFSSQKSGESLKRDLEIYLRRNLFQTGLLEDHCKNHSKPLELFDFFIEQALVYFENDISTQLYFYQLQADINKQKQVEILRKISDIDITTISSTYDRYALLKIRLQLSLEVSKGNPQGIFNLFMDFSRYAREYTGLAGEEKDTIKKLIDACVNVLSNHSDTIFEWAKQKYPQVNWADLRLQAKYPYFYAKDIQGNTMVALDLCEGHILINGLYPYNPPQSLVQAQKIIQNQSDFQNGQLTGFSLVNQNIHLLTNFEEADFTQILFNQDTQQIKINFSRLTIKLEGRLVDNIWDVHMADKAHLKLVNSRDIVMQPIMKNSLIFEDSTTKERIVYTPNGFSYTIDPKTNELKSKAEDFEAQLYLVYANLIENRFEAAVQCIQWLLKSGPLKGTPGELDRIHKIIEAGSEYSEWMDRPERIALKAHLLSACSHLQLKSNLLKIMHQYNHIRHYLPLGSNLVLSSFTEYQLLRRHWPQIKNDNRLNSLKARYFFLKGEQLKKEKGFIENLKIKTKVHQDRLKIIIGKLNKKRVFKSQISTWGAVEHSFELPNSKSLINPNDTEVDACVWENSAPMNLVPNISEEAFLAQFRDLYEIARNVQSQRRQELEIFLENTLKANCLIPLEKHKSLVPSWAAVLMVVMRNPDKFPDLTFKKEGGNNLDLIFETAHSLSPHLTIQFEDYLSHSVEKPLAAHIDSSDNREIPIEITSESDKQFDYDQFIRQMALTDLDQEVETLKKATEKEIEILKANLKPKIQDKPYLESETLRREGDEKVGLLRLKRNQEVDAVAKKYLYEKTVRENILNKITGWIKGLKKQLKQHKEAVLQLVNARSDPQVLLNRLFISSDLNEYRKNTELNETDIQCLHNRMAQIMHLSSLKTHYKKIKKELKKPENQLQIPELATLLLTKNHIDYTDAVLQFFQKEEGILLRFEQMQAIKQLLARNKETGKFEDILIQLSMGAGKTKIIAPLVAFKKANGTNLVILMVMSSLRQVTYSDLTEKFSRLFNRVPYLLIFERQPMIFKPIKALDGTEFFQSDVYKTIYNDLHDAMLQKNCVQTDNISMTSLRLQYEETLGLISPPAQGSKAHEEWLRQIKILSRIALLFKLQGDLMMDEGHYLLAPNQKLNFAIGLPINIPREYSSLHADFFFFCAYITPNIEGLPPDKTVYDLMAQNNLISDPDKQIPLIQRAIAKGLVSDKTEVNPLKYLASILIEPNDQDCMIQYLMNKTYDPNSTEEIEPMVESILDKLKTDQRDQVAFIKGNLSIVLPITIMKNYNEHYGSISLSNKGKVENSEIKKRQAGPFIATHTPKKRSEFGHLIESMNYTGQLNIIEPISDNVVKELVQEALEEATEERRADPKLTLSQTQASLSFNKTFCQETDMTLERMAKSLRDNSSIESFKHSKTVKKSILTEKVVPLIKINPTVLSVDSQELANLCNSVQVMTATPFNYRTYHSRIQFNAIDHLGIEGEKIAVLKSKKKNIQVKPCRNYSSPADLLAEMMQNCPVPKKVRMIIDVGGLCTNEKLTLESVQKIGEYYKKNPEASSELIRCVVYGDNRDDILYDWNIYDNTHKKYIIERLKYTPDARFTYLDQNRILSIDIDQMSDAYAFVTMGRGTFDTSLIQGIYRERKFSNDQSVMIVRPDYLTQHGKDDVEHIIEFGRKNRTDYCLKIHPKVSIDKLRETVKEALLEKIREESDPFLQSILYRKIQSVFLKVYQLSYFELYGGVDRVLKTKEFFKQLKLNCYKQWLEALKKIESSVSDLEKKQMRDRLKKLVKEALLICPDTIRAQSLYDIGLEIEKEIENEVEVENKRVIYDSLLIGNLEDAPFVFEPHHYPLTKDHPNLISLFESDLILKGEFDKNLFMTKQQAWTLKKDLENYHNGYTKPIMIVMIIASKKDPNQTLQFVILTIPEACYYIQNKNDSEYYIWFVSPQDTFLYGTRPDKLPENYNKILEQVRFINGDIRKILRQKEGITWLLFNLEKKMHFLRDKILSWLPSARAKPYPMLDRITKRILMDDNSAQSLATEKLKEAQWAQEKAERAKLRAEKLVTQEAQRQAELEAANLERVAAEALDAQRLVAEKANQAHKPEQQAAAEKEREAAIKRTQTEISQSLSVKAAQKQKKEERVHQENERLNELKKEAEAGRLAVEKRAIEKREAEKHVQSANIQASASDSDPIKNLPLNFFQKIINFIKDSIDKIKAWFFKRMNKSSARVYSPCRPSQCTEPLTVLASVQQPRCAPINTVVPEHKIKVRKRGPASWH